MACLHLTAAKRIGRKHVHAPRSRAHARRHTFHGHYSYIQLAPADQTSNCQDQQILERATGNRYKIQRVGLACLHFTAPKRRELFAQQKEPHKHTKQCECDKQCNKQCKKQYTNSNNFFAARQKSISHRTKNNNYQTDLQFNADKTMKTIVAGKHPGQDT